MGNWRQTLTLGMPQDVFAPVVHAPSCHRAGWAEPISSLGALLRGLVPLNGPSHVSGPFVSRPISGMGVGLSLLALPRTCRLRRCGRFWLASSFVRRLAGPTCATGLMPSTAGTRACPSSSRRAGRQMPSNRHRAGRPPARDSRQSPRTARTCGSCPHARR